MNPWSPRELNQHRIWKRLVNVLATGCVGVVGVAACTGESGSEPRDAAAGEPSGPNVVLVVFDTTRGDRCSVNGYDRPTTPTLEALAEQGAVFRDCWSPSPWTAPAHASIFTGLRPPNHGLIGLGARQHLAKEHVTLAEHFEEAGYRTACYTANDFVAAPFGLSQGFRQFWGVWDEAEFDGLVAEKAHALAADWAIDQHRLGRPFFLFINDMEPHSPYDPPEEYRQRFAPTASTEELAKAIEFTWPRTIAYTMGMGDESPRTLELVSALYDAEIASLDAALAPLIASLDEAGILDETIVIVAGDHGENLGERHMAGHVFSVHRSVLHVPLVIRYPKAFAEGTVIDDTVRLEDLFPTILELCQLDVPANLDGASLLRDLPGRIARGVYDEQPNVIRAAQQNFPFADITPFRGALRSVYDGRYHYMVRSDGGEEFYDVTEDPLERRNLAASGGEPIQRLRTLVGN